MVLRGIQTEETDQEVQSALAWTITLLKMDKVKPHETLLFLFKMFEFVTFLAMRTATPESLR